MKAFAVGIVLVMVWGIFPVKGWCSLDPEKPPLDPNEIVAKADKIRVPKGSYELETTVTNFEGDKSLGESEYRVYVKDLDHSLVEFRAPPSEKGKSLLMLEDDVWIYLPRVKRPVRVPLQQRLLGQVAIGDMVRTNFSHDYEATFLGEEDFQGEPAYVLDLKAKSDKKAYHRIKYYVSKNDYRPLFAEFFSVSGQALKTLTFQDYRLVDGKLRPLESFFQDSINKDKTTSLKFTKMTTKKLKDMMFSKQYMRSLE